MNFEYYEYLLLLAIDLNLCCGNNKSISIENFKKFRKVLLNNFKEFVMENKNMLTGKQKACFVNFNKLNLMLTSFDEMLLIENFLDKYPDDFYLEDCNTIDIFSKDNEQLIDKVLVLEDKLLSTFSSEEQDLFQIIGNLISNKEIIDIFNIKKIPNDLNKLMFLECALENNYNILDEETLKKNETLLNICTNKIYEGIEYNSIMHYSNYIINSLLDNPITLYSSDATNNIFFEDHAYLADTDNLFYQAVFTNNPLFLEKIYTKIDLLLLENETEDTEEYDEDTEEYDDEEIQFNENEILTKNLQSEIALFLMYYITLDNYEKLHGDENQNIVRIKRRLLYLINGYGYQVYNITNLKDLLNQITKSDDYTSRNYQQLAYCLSIMFLIDIFDCNYIDDKTYLKILYVKNYVDFTGDLEPIQLFLMGYVNHKNYAEVFDGIFKNSKISLGESKMR